MNIALIGYGVENASAYRYLSHKHHKATFTVYDEAEAPASELPKNVAFVGGQTEFTDIEADLVVRSPGISPYKIKTDAPVTTATKLFFDVCTVPIIGVTGSKGKGTTASLIASILRAGRKTVWLVGNIGMPALDIVDSIGKDEIVVYEMSSFQLWDLDKSPETAVVLMIEPEHLDVHKDVEDYVNAKSNIARFQKRTDRVIYNEGNDFSRQIAQLSPGRIYAYPDIETAHIEDGYFYRGSTRICLVGELQLPGMHNIENAEAAIDAAWPWVSDPEAIANGLRNFDGLPHRLKFVAEHEGIQYYDDSIATTPGSAIAAIRSFDEPKVLILGGSSKGADFSELARVIEGDVVQHVVLIGSEAPRIKAALDEVGYEHYTDLGVTDMKHIVKTAHKHAGEGSVVILSPACASFGMFRNYVDRGEQFIRAVNQLRG